MDIILFGMQGSGKGTQGKELTAKYGLKVFEMGGELRRIIASGSELGNKIIVHSCSPQDTENLFRFAVSFLVVEHPMENFIFVLHMF